MLSYAYPLHRGRNGIRLFPFVLTTLAIILVLRNVRDFGQPENRLRLLLIVVSLAHVVSHLDVLPPDLRISRCRVQWLWLMLHIELADDGP
jgi:hypothetical protein